MFNIKYRYIVFYITDDGIEQGNFDWLSKKKISCSADVLNIEQKLEDTLSRKAIITNYKYVGWTWK